MKERETIEMCRWKKGKLLKCGDERKGNYWNVEMKERETTEMCRWKKGKLLKCGDERKGNWNVEMKERETIWNV